MSVSLINQENVCHLRQTPSIHTISNEIFTVFVAVWLLVIIAGAYKYLVNWLLGHLAQVY